MSITHGSGRRFAGGGQVMASQLAIQLGYAAITGLAPLGASFAMMATGGVMLAFWVGFRDGMRLRDFDRTMWWYVIRLAAGNAVVSFSALYANRHLGLGATASVMVLGTLSVGLRDVWHDRRTAWGIQHLAWRAVAFGGILWLNLVLNDPLRSGLDFWGPVCAVVSAVCIWNTPTTIGKMRSRGLTDQGAAMANLVAAAALAGILLVLRNHDWTSPRLLVLAGMAGALTVCVPALLQNAAIRRTEPRDLAVVLSLTPAVAALVAQAGVVLGRLDSTQRTTSWEWAAITLIIIASVLDSRVAPRPEGAERKHADRGGRHRRHRSGGRHR